MTLKFLYFSVAGIYTSSAMKNHKSLEAHQFFRAGWVHTIRHLKTVKGIYVLHTGVRPSQRVGDKPHLPWVGIDNDGSVVAAHCNCMAG